MTMQECWDMLKTQNTNDVNKKKLLHLLNTHPQRHNAMWLARSIGKLNTSYTKEADHYCTTKTNPYWAKGKTPVRTIGNHKFYKLL